MLARSIAATPWGIDARPLEVEVDVPQMQLVGLPDTAVRESRDRVRAAIKNCGFKLPPRSVVINLAPADLRKARHLFGPPACLFVAVGLGEEEAGGAVLKAHRVDEKGAAGAPLA